jgi:tRNA-binding protein
MVFVRKGRAGAEWRRSPHDGRLLSGRWSTIRAPVLRAPNQSAIDSSRLAAQQGNIGEEAFAMEIQWDDFLKVELRVGTIVTCEPFPQARKPAFILMIDFGEELGVRKSSAQVTDLYDPESLLGKQVIAVVNFPPKQIGPIQSQCLVTGFYRNDGSVVLAVPDQAVANGARLA